MPQHLTTEEPRLGKRVRRKPQRWEGDRDDPPHASAHQEAHLHHRSSGAQPSSYGTIAPGDHPQAPPPVDEDGSTATIVSHESLNDTPVLDDGLGNLRRAVETARAQPSARDAVDYLHSWQLRAVSHQAAQLKALHVVLKRRLRKRSARSPEHDRLEEDALRNARAAPRTHPGPSNRHGERDDGDGDNDGDDGGDDDDDADDDDMDDGADDNGRHHHDENGNSTPAAERRRRRRRQPRRREATEEAKRDDRNTENDLVPRDVRLPLEAYLPRRVRPRYLRLMPADVRDRITPPSEHQALQPRSAPDGLQRWHVLPTVAASAEWNTRKSAARPHKALKDGDGARTPASRDDM